MEPRVRILDFIPEMTAGFSFFSAGIYFGYVFHINSFSEWFNKDMDLDYILHWPFAISASSAILTAAVLHSIKVYLKREHFNHFYFLMFAMVIFIVTGICFLMGMYELATSLGAVAHGIVYIAGLSYVNIRIYRRRAFRLVFCYVYYFFGYAYCVNEMNSNYKQVFNGPFVALGYALEVQAVIYLISLVQVEILDWTNYIQYKQSLDPELNEGIYRKTRTELIHHLRTRYVLGQNLYIGREKYRRAFVWMLFTKLTGFFLFHAMLQQYAAESVAYYLQADDYFVIQWTIFGAVLLTWLVMLKISARTWLIISVLGAAITFVVLAINGRSDFSRTAIPFIVFYAFIAMARTMSDVCILETTPVKYAEIVLAIAYLIEMVPIALLYYHFNYDRLSVSTMNTRIDILTQSIYLVPVLVVILIIVFLKMPNTFGKSLTEIRVNIFWDIRYGSRSGNDSTSTSLTSVASVAAPTVSTASTPAATPTLPGYPSWPDPHTNHPIQNPQQEQMRYWSQASMYQEDIRQKQQQKFDEIQNSNPSVHNQPA